MSAGTFGFLVLVSICSVSASAETYGPFFYRIGVPESYVGFATSLSLDGSNLVVENCIQVVFPGKRQCSSQTFRQGEFSLTDDTVEYVSGNIEKVDRKSRLFMIEDKHDHHEIVRNVGERFEGWETAPANWLAR
ncbi:MAG: hypothetical protein JSR78_16635 [Proteobacteria bacterium]|nr:hypothetical protein [Pseudomonadota bacterium]